MSLFSWIFGEKKDNEVQITEHQAREEYTERRKNQGEMTLMVGQKRLISTTELPAAYDSVKLSGTRIVNGKFCTTVGEIKEATEEFYRNK